MIRGTFGLEQCNQGNFLSGMVLSGAFLALDGVIKGFFGLGRCDQGHFWSRTV